MYQWKKTDERISKEKTGQSDNKKNIKKNKKRKLKTDQH